MEQLLDWWAMLVKWVEVGLAWLSACPRGQKRTGWSDRLLYVTCAPRNGCFCRIPRKRLTKTDPQRAMRVCIHQCIVVFGRAMEGVVGTSRRSHHLTQVNETGKRRGLRLKFLTAHALQYVQGDEDLTSRVRDWTCSYHLVAYARQWQSGPT